MPIQSSPLAPATQLRPEEETDLQSLLGPPAFLMGEDGNAYETLKIRIYAAVKPEDAIEEIWVRDILDLLWETVRLRRFKARLMYVAAHQGLESILRPRVPGMFSVDHLVQGWAQRDPEIVKEVKRVLRSAGLAEEDIAAQTLADNCDTFEKIDRLIMQTETRRHVVLREIDRRRDALARRLREVSTQVEDGEFALIAPPHREAAE